jgi:hypothetical protein
LKGELASFERPKSEWIWTKGTEPGGNTISRTPPNLEMMVRSHDALVSGKTPKAMKGAAPMASALVRAWEQAVTIGFSSDCFRENSQLKMPERVHREE